MTEYCDSEEAARDGLLRFVGAIPTLYRKRSLQSRDSYRIRRHPLSEQVRPQVHVPSMAEHEALTERVRELEKFVLSLAARVRDLERAESGDTPVEERN